MLPKWLIALLVVLQEAWAAGRDAQIRFLKLQIERVKSRLPGNRVILDPVERRRLMKVGAELGHAVEHPVDIVSIKTCRRWVREGRGGRQPGKVGRPRLTKSLRELIVRLARKNAGWGDRRLPVLQRHLPRGNEHNVLRQPDLCAVARGLVPRAAGAGDKPPRYGLIGARA